MESDMVCYLLGLASSAATLLCGMINVEPKKTGRIISYVFAPVPAILVLLKIIGINVPDFVQRRLPFIFICILAIVALVFILALLDKGKSQLAVRKGKGYCIKNLGFNLLGAVAVGVMFFIAHTEIADFRFLEEFYIQEIMEILIPACLFIVLSYQSIEQEQSRREEMDHSPSLEWKNQICNVLYLFNTYFWSMTSAVFVVSYTIYCHIHHVPLYLNISYLLFLTGALIFFYACGGHKNEHVHMIFAICVPMILISSMYWMSWFTVDRNMVRWQIGFIVLHFLIYVLILYIKKQIIVKGQNYNPAYRIRIKIFGIQIKDWFYVCIPFMIATAYAILWLVPLSIERIPCHKAENYINAICMDTDKNADELLDEIKSMEWWDDENEDADYTRYLKFLYDNLKEELLGKGIITKEEQSLSYKKLDDWFDNLPWKNFADSQASG